MTFQTSLDPLLTSPAPLLALAPMQDVTDLPFWRLMARYGGPDVYYTEYFRVHPTSNLEPWILESLTQNPTGRPAIAQMIGNDVPSLVRTAKQLMTHPVAGIDLNLGCPAPVVYRKCAGGGLLRELKRVDAILEALRQVVTTRFTVKTRIGFDSPAGFDDLLSLFAKHQIDLLTVHGRTVYEGYRSEVHYEFIAKAVTRLRCPVLANGNIYSADKAAQVLQSTGARGLMIGRAAIRNPWLFDQIRRHQNGEVPVLPTGRQVLGYVRELFETTRPAGMRPEIHVEKMKKYTNFLGVGVEPTGQFLHQIRRVSGEVQFFEVLHRFLDHNDPMPLDPFPLQLAERDQLAGEHR
jgi:tRNA-dihydrouridine synthase B